MKTKAKKTLSKKSKRKLTGPSNDLLGRFTSDSLNEKLSAISDEADEYGYESFGGKAIPYIGWYWRNVDFNEQGSYSFGVLPVITGFDGNDKPRVGFMENNKWDYKYITATPEQWKAIKQKLVAVAVKPCRETLKAADDEIQSLLT